MTTKKLRCRCYINLKYYSKVARTGVGTFKGYTPCPIHEKEDYVLFLKDIEDPKESKEGK